MRTVALIQARMGSTRLPCKMMLHLVDAPLIDWVVSRVSASTLLDAVVLATSESSGDDVLASRVREKFPQVAVFRGSENDVLGRFYGAARETGADHVVRVCADNPLIAGEAIDELIRFYRAGSYDYAYNHIPRGNTWPDGLGAEIVPFAVLDRLYREATKLEHREHCLSHIWDNPGKFSIATFDPADPDLRRPDIRIDVDTSADYRKLALLPLRRTMTALDIVALFPRSAGETPA